MRVSILFVALVLFISNLSWSQFFRKKATALEPIPAVVNNLASKEKAESLSKDHYQQVLKFSGHAQQVRTLSLTISEQIVATDSKLRRLRDMEKSNPSYENVLNRVAHSNHLSLLNHAQEQLNACQLDKAFDDVAGAFQKSYEQMQGAVQKFQNNMVNENPANHTSN